MTMKITCLGDSFTEGYLVDKNYTRFLREAGFEVINLGINGDMTGQMLKRVPKNQSEVLIIFGATNDFYNGISPSVAYENIKSILAKAKADTTIVIIPPYVEEEYSYPFYRQVNDKIDEFASLIKKENLNILDSRLIRTHYLDGLHMGEKFHKELSKEIIKKIEEIYD